MENTIFALTIGFTMFLCMAGAAALMGRRWIILSGVILGVVAEITISHTPGQVTAGHFEPWIQEASAAFLSAGFIALQLLLLGGVEETRTELRISRNIRRCRAEEEANQLQARLVHEYQHGLGS